MKEFNLLNSCDLVSPDVLYLGYHRLWINTQELSNYACDRMLAGDNSETICYLAGLLSDDDKFSIKQYLQDWTQQQVSKSFLYESEAADRWRYAFLKMILEKQLSYEQKVEKIQEVFADFAYPHDMIRCTPYFSSRDDFPEFREPSRGPLEETKILVTKLEARLLQ